MLYGRKYWRKTCEILLELTIKTPERRSRVFIVNWTYFTPSSSVFMVDSEQGGVCWEPVESFSRSTVKQEQQ